MNLSRVRQFGRALFKPIGRYGAVFVGGRGRVVLEMTIGDERNTTHRIPVTAADELVSRSMEIKIKSTVPGLSSLARAAFRPRRGGWGSLVPPPPPSPKIPVRGRHEKGFSIYIDCAARHTHT